MQRPVRIGLHDETTIAVLIVAVTVFGAFVTWQAASASGTATDLDQRGRQERILEERRRSELRSTVSYEQQLFGSFEGHVRLADSLTSDAAESRDDPELAHSLAAEASTERALARSLQMFFFAGYPLDADGRPAYDQRQILASTIELDPILADLQPERLEGAADSARSKRFWLVVIDAAAVAAIFLLTLSLLGTRHPADDPDREGAARPGFASAGAALLASTVVGFVLVEILIEVPAG